MGLVTCHLFLIMQVRKLSMDSLLQRPLFRFARCTNRLAPQLSMEEVWCCNSYLQHKQQFVLQVNNTVIVVVKVIVTYNTSKTSRWQLPPVYIEIEESGEENGSAQVPKFSFTAGHNGNLHMPLDEVAQIGLLVSIVSH